MKTTPLKVSAQPRTAAVVGMAALWALAGCGGGGGSDSSGGSTSGGGAAAPANASTGGIWNGTDQATGLALVGLVTETGEFHFIRSDDTQYFGTLTTSGNNVSGNLTGVTAVGYMFPDGSTTGTGTYTGTVQARATLNGSVRFTTQRGETATGNATLSFNSVYNQSSSLAKIAGNYRDLDTNAVINLSSNGVIFTQDPVTGCLTNGVVAVINSSYNAYRIEYSFTGCRAPYTRLNGTTARGLATLDTTTSPNRAVIGVVNASAGYSLAGAYPRI
jgi:hypothetical protein